MQIPFKALKPYVVLLLIVVIAYLPVSTFYFGMKNDAFSDNFPNKFFLSEALHSGHLPLWNPYINFGLPVYADMGFAFYNPITWLFGLIGYNAYTLTLEVLLYIYIGGIFMYRLGRCMQFSKLVSITVAAMYMCSGFYTGCLQYINFLTAAAFVPWAVQAFLMLLSSPSLKRSFLLAAACYFVFAGGHPAMPIILIYFLLLILLFSLLFSRQYRTGIKKISLYLLAAVGLFILFYLPAIYSYATILPHYSRNMPEQQSLYTDAGFTLSSYLSFIFPFATGVNQPVFSTAISMCNGFFSVTGIICVLIAWKNIQPLSKTLLLTAFGMLLLSAGGPAKAFIYNCLPLLNYIRYNGEFRIYAILCFCIIAGFGLTRLAANDVNYTKYFKRGLQTLLAISVCVFTGLIFFNHTDISKALSAFNLPVTFAQKIKSFLGSPFTVFLCVSVLITAAVCVASLYAVKKNKFRLLLLITIVDVCVNSIAYLPVTGVGQKTVKSIQAVYNSSPAGIPIPPLIPVNKIDTLDAVTTGLVGDISFYNKSIGTTRLTDYPSYFTTTDSFFQNKSLAQKVLNHPYLFLNSGQVPSSSIQVLAFGPQKIELQVNTAETDTLVFLQNNYPFWHAIVNNKPAAIQTAEGTFISVKLDKGINNVVFYYKDGWLYICILISAAAFLASVFLTFRKKSYL